MSKSAAAAALVVIVAACAFVAALSGSNDALWAIAAGVVGLVALVMLAGIYILDAGFRGFGAARTIKDDDRRL